jgi:hypothetical protein
MNNVNSTSATNSQTLIRTIKTATETHRRLTRKNGEDEETIEEIIINSTECNDYAPPEIIPVHAPRSSKYLGFLLLNLLKMKEYWELVQFLFPFIGH